MKKRKPTAIYAADFETVTGDVERTYPWSCALCEVGNEDPEKVKVFANIPDMFSYLTSVGKEIVLYFHNLKFDGEFIVSYLLKHNWKWVEENPGRGEFTCRISDRGVWYFIEIGLRNGHKLTIFDSVKLFPFPLRSVGKAFNTKHQKTEMEYEGKTSLKDCTEEDIDYIKNDVLVLAEALDYMFKKGHTRMTIGSNCMHEFRERYTKQDWEEEFPDVYQMPLPPEIGDGSVGDYILSTYGGGWCYKDGEGQTVTKSGFTVDANSLYPSVMHSKSGSVYPYGNPHFWKGNEVPAEAIAPNKYFFVRFRCRFELKPGYLPFVHIRNDRHYPANKNLTTSDYWSTRKNKYVKYSIGADGIKRKIRPSLSMTCKDYELFRRHYNVEDFEIIDGCWFWARAGIFDEYIDKWYPIKQEGKGAMRSLAKLFLNNLYGQFAKTTDSSYKVPFLDENGIVCYNRVEAHEKKPGYIPIGSAITSYARCTTIPAAQANYHGSSPGFRYADTDSLHCDMPLSELKGVDLHESDLCKWKVELEWDKAVFLRQKTYLEQKGTKINVTCAGMPDVCKGKFIEDVLKMEKRIEDFDVGLSVDGKLYQRHVPGGIVLVEGRFRIL